MWHFQIVSCASGGTIEYDNIDEPHLYGQRMFNCHKRLVFDVSSLMHRLICGTRIINTLIYFFSRWPQYQMTPIHSYHVGTIQTFAGLICARVRRVMFIGWNSEIINLNLFKLLNKLNKLI